MSEPGLIRDYLATLSAQLPAPVAEELADGLTETYESFLRQGLAPDRAAESAVAEFGEPHVILVGFASVNPARRLARRLLGIGPAVGACWAAALITSRAWAWPVPPVARILPGLILIAVVALLVTAAFGTRYRLIACAGAAGCVGITVLDTVMIIGVALTIPSVTWVTIGAMAASTGRIAFSARTLRAVLTG
jgi:hypothetical protein